MTAYRAAMRPHGPVAWRHWGNMTPSPPAPEPYTQGAGLYPAAGADR